MKKERSYIDSVHHAGRIWNLSMVVILLLFPVSVSLLFHAPVDWHGFVLGMLSTAPMYWAVGVIETFTYVPMLGAGGSYLAFVTGNITNLKAPAALNALELFEADVKTAEGEVVSTIAIATSAITTTLILAVGVLLFSPVLPLIKESKLLAPAFQQVLPALFGALGAGYFMKHWRISILPIVVMVIVLVFSGGIPAGTLVPIGVVVSLLGAFGMFKLGWIGSKNTDAVKE